MILVAVRDEWVRDREGITDWAKGRNSQRTYSY